uniref:Chitin-binding type-2 domain-containing protein n=1 Tax=Anopheles coluzzii TaxID=1518534 RepID=A0A8W7Q130_ANOCL
MLRCIPGDRDQCPERTEPDWDQFCSGVSYAFYAHPAVCWEFVFCSLGNANRYSCPMGSVYHASTRSCVPGNDDTCERFDSICSGRLDGIIPHPTTCNAFVYCTSGQAVFEQCGPGTIFKQGMSGCVVGNTETCTEAKTICTDHADHTLASSPTYKYVPLGIFCTIQAAPLRCPPGEILNEQAQICAPGNVTSCQFNPVETMCHNKINNAIYPHPNDCSRFVQCSDGQGRPDGVIPHPEGCALFLLCTSGFTAAFRCPEGEILHPEFLVCAAGNADDCSLAPVTTEPSIISVCEGRPDGNYTHPLLCYLFIHCTNGATEIRSCPKDQIFVGAIRGCAPGNQESCIPL